MFVSAHKRGSGAVPLRREARQVQVRGTRGVRSGHSQVQGARGVRAFESGPGAAVFDNRSGHHGDDGRHRLWEASERNGGLSDAVQVTTTAGSRRDTRYL